MPALSPTMTEGKISSWKVKEGDSFSAGDVLLDIETDKAQMDVEAQDDGIMAKIIHPEGSEAIKVGARIAVIADSGDDLSTLEIPAEDKSEAPSPKKESEEMKPEKTSPSQAEAPPTSKASSTSNSSTKKPAKKSSKAQAQTYPLLPSVQFLLHENGLEESDISKMTPTGPNNRLLKGDVLAYLGSISDEYPGDLSTKLNKLTHLDLSNIKVAPRKEIKKEAKQEAVPEVAKDIDVALPVSMAAVLEIQKRIQTTLGVTMPLSTFILRASDYANDDLPQSKSYKPSADELFNAVLGLDKVSSNGVRGGFIPQITALPATAIATMPRPQRAAQQSDIIDLLSGKRTVARKAPAPRIPGVAATTNIFSVSVPKGDERRAQIFLERVKDVLETEPGSLVL